MVLYEFLTINLFTSGNSKQLSVTCKPKSFGCYVKHQLIREQKKRVNEHQTHKEKETTSSTDESLKPVELFLVNIHGLVTNEKNKCAFLKEITSTSDTQSKRIGITETWGKKHFDGEYLKAFKDYNITKKDRDTSKAAVEDDSLSKNGGVMLLTSKDIPQTPITEFSNGNCELVIAEMPTINTVGIVFYRPSGISRNTTRL